MSNTLKKRRSATALSDTSDAEASALRAADDAVSARTMAERQEAVGYCRPPKHSRFKQGCSGNPSGRPKRRPNLKLEILKVFTDLITLREGDSVTRVPAIVAAHCVQRNRALKGDPRAALNFFKIAKELGVLDQEEACVPEFSKEFLERLSDETLDELIRVGKGLTPRGSAK